MEIERKHNLIEQRFNSLKDLHKWDNHDEYIKHYYAIGDSVLRFEPVKKQWTFKYKITPTQRIEIDDKNTLREIEEVIVNEYNYLYKDFRDCVDKYFAGHMTDYVQTERYSMHSGGMLITLDKFSNGKRTLYEIEFELITTDKFNNNVIELFVDKKSRDDRNKLTKLHRGVR